ncbi:TonB-dependent receptor [Mucilaginibacter ginkgonis]|uniref:TonB-dependent receptor n=1 Tax=Mucilaginibacter ginkgonis TaxID=2682091 RepID=A0A6I4IP60_9SPHI|nr:TonB-dependent receptor [Mucilaginibacter ginkgonis]QQL49162.1 TonB-dependent receptor [Mucilaginibacter ginkgonis]
MRYIYDNFRSFTFLILFLLLAGTAFAANIGGNDAEKNTGKIAGIVTTKDGKPAADVTVTIIELNKATATEANGTFIFQNVKPGTYTVRATFVGSATEAGTVIVAAGKTATVNFMLSETASQLNEVTIRSAKTLNSTKVTFDKAGIRPLDLPQSAGVVTSQVIQDQQINRLGDAVRNVSGVTLTQQRGGVGETFTARGYSIGIGGGSGSIFKNGVLTNTAGFPEAATLESVEILKGTSALMYGNVSGGVIINMVTKKPKFDFGGELSMRAGSYNFYKPVIDVYGPISKNVAFRTIGVYENDGSYRDHVKTERVYVNPSLLFNLGKSTTLLIEGDYLKSNLTPDWGVGSLNLGQAIPTMVPRNQFINTSWAYSRMNQYSGMATLNHSFSDTWKLNAIISTQSTEIDSYGSSLPNNVAANGDWNRGLQRAHTKENNYTGQLNLNGRFHTGFLGHQLLIGTDVAKVVNLSKAYTVNGTQIASYAYDKINIIDLTKFAARTDMPDALATTLTHSPVYRFGSYIQDLITITPKFKVLAGVRWSWQQTYQTTIDSLQKSKSINGTAPTKYDRAYSPKVALIYQPIPTTSVYATYSNNFIFNTGTDISGRGLDPSIVNQYEAGVKNEFLNGKLSVNASVYRIRNSNLAVTNPNNIAFRMLNGETTSDGLEIDVNGNLSRNFYFIMGYGYNFARYTNSSGLTGSPINGEQIVINPRNTANASLFYTFYDGALRGFKFGASSFYTGKRLAGYNNTVGQTQNYSRLLPVGGFATLDLSAGYSYKKFSILAQVSNVTNTFNYLIHDNYSVTPIPPTQFLTTVSYKF